MLKLAPKNLRPGMVLARSVYNSKGMLVTPAGTKLEQSHIDRLLNLKISEVYIDDPRVRDLEIEEPIEEKTRVEALAVLKEAFEQAERKGSIGSRQLTTKIAEIAKRIAGDLETRRPQVANLFPVEGGGNDYFVFQS